MTETERDPLWPIAALAALPEHAERKPDAPATLEVLGPLPLRGT